MQGGERRHEDEHEAQRYGRALRRVRDLAHQPSRRGEGKPGEEQPERAGCAVVQIGQRQDELRSQRGIAIGRRVVLDAIGLRQFGPCRSVLA